MANGDDNETITSPGWTPPVGGLVGNSMIMAHRRLAQKQQDAYERMMEGYANLYSPDPAKFQQNSIDNIDEALEELVGKGYKEHQPFILHTLKNLGNAFLGQFGAQLPQARASNVPMAVDPKTGQPIQAGLAQGGLAALAGLKKPQGPAIPAIQTGTPGLGQAAPAIQVGTSGPAEATPMATIAGTAPQPPATSAAPSTLTADQAQKEPYAPTTPVSTLAPSATQGGATPATMAAPTPPPGLTPQQLREWKLKPISEGGGGGSLLYPKDPRSPVIMPEPQDVRRAGRTDFLAQKGVFGKTAQQTQEIINDYHKAVMSGVMTVDEAKEGIKKAFMAEVEPKTSTATGTEGKTHIAFPARPAHKDPATGEEIPAQEAHVELYDRNSKTGNLMYHGRDVSWAEIDAQGGKEIDKPGAPYRTQGTLPGTAQQVIDAFTQHPEWGKPNPMWQYKGTWQHDPQNPDAPPKLVSMTPQATNQMNDRLFNRNYNIAQNKYPTQPNGQPATPQQWARIAAAMTQRQEAVQMAAQQQRMGVQERLYNVPSGQGLLLTPQEAQQIGVTEAPGFQVPDWVTNPTAQDIDQFLDPTGASVGAGAGGTPPGGAGFPGGAGANAMMGLEAPSTTPAPTQQAPAPAPAAPAPAPGAGAQAPPPGPAAGSPAAPPRPAQQPQQNQQLAAQVAAQQQTAAQQRVAAQVAAQRQAQTAQAQQQQPVGQALPDQNGQQYNALGVPIIPREQKRATMLQSYVASITPGNAQTQFDKVNASDGANLIAKENGISLGDLYRYGIQWVGNADALKQRINQRNNMQRFVEQLNAFTDAWLDVQAKVPDWGSIIGNSFDRNAIQLLIDDPRAQAAQVSAQAMMRAWNAITSNAYLSSGALPEGSRLDIAQTFAHGNLTMQRAYTTAARLKVEGDIEMWSFDHSTWNTNKEQFENPIGKSLGVTLPKEPQLPASAGPRPREGTIVKGADGIFRRYSSAHDAYIPDPKLNQPQQQKK